MGASDFVGSITRQYVLAFAMCLTWSIGGVRIKWRKTLGSPFESNPQHASWSFKERLVTQSQYSLCHHPPPTLSFTQPPHEVCIHLLVESLSHSHRVIVQEQKFIYASKALHRRLC